METFTQATTATENLMAMASISGRMAQFIKVRKFLI